MTAPTPDEWADGIAFLKRLVISDSHRSDRAQALLDGIAAVTTERDQAVENAGASQQMHEQARSLLDQTLTERDQARADLDKEIDHCRDTAGALREVIARWDKARQRIADAPHADDCQHAYLSGVDDIACSCWKGEL